MTKKISTNRKQKTKFGRSGKLSGRGIIKLILAVLIVGAAFLVANMVLSDQKANGTSTPTIYISPAAKKIAKGKAITVKVYENSYSQSVNAVEVKIVYNATRLKLLKVNSTGSAFTLRVQSLASPGKITVTRGYIGSLTGKQFVTSLTFQARADHEVGKVNFASGTVLLSSSDNTNILGKKINGAYTLTH